ncbi:hypothetical protein RB653_000619 [Dictyostelium firmibasis]|uniref:Uncharacterized protein n=1 Tax=Dictyostelium firmibasis TaxID=79012 RepID=A0AAN7YY14_9MYCE
MNFNKLLIILSTIFFLTSTFIKIGEASCSDQLAGHFNQNNQNVQLTVVRPQGDVVYISNTLYYYTGFLTNGNSFPAVFSSKTRTTASGRVQPFDIDQQETSFYDRSGIVFRQDGSLTVRALWGNFNANLTCVNSGSLNYGIADNGYLVSLQFK